MEEASYSNHLKSKPVMSFCVVNKVGTLCVCGGPKGKDPGENRKLLMVFGNMLFFLACVGLRHMTTKAKNSHQNKTVALLLRSAEVAHLQEGLGLGKNIEKEDIFWSIWCISAGFLKQLDHSIHGTSPSKYIY